MEPGSAPTLAPQLPFARAIVFYGSFTLMTIEMVASRVLAPHLGASLYTWTSIIAVILIGVSLGNWFGGQVADRGVTRKTLGLSFGCAGIMALVAIPLSQAVGPVLASAQWPVWFATVLFCLTVFFPTAFFLSTVSPQVVKVAVDTLDRAGVEAGAIGASGAAGSIAGTFLSGFVFLMYVGTRELLIALACSLLLVGIAIAFLPSSRSTPSV